MERHYQILGALYVALGIFSLLGAATVFIAVAGGGLISGHMETIAITGVVATIVGGFWALLSLPGVIVGVGLLTMKPWSRVLGIVMSVLNLFNIPFGTILGVYGLMVLTRPEASEVLRKG